MDEDNYKEINFDFLIEMIKDYIHMFLCVVIITVIVATLWKIGSTGEVSNHISNITTTEKLKYIEKNNIVISPLESHSNENSQRIHPIIYIGNAIKKPMLYVANTIKTDTILKDTENTIYEVNRNANKSVVKINEVSEIREKVKEITYYEKEKNIK